MVIVWVVGIGVALRVMVSVATLLSVRVVVVVMVILKMMMVISVYGDCGGDSGVDGACRGDYVGDRSVMVVMLACLSS